MDNVTRAAWRSHPRQCPAAPTPRTGTCSCCGTAGPVWPASTAVSRNFTAYDTWSNATTHCLCEACVWAYTTPDLRTTPHLVTTDATLTALTLTDTHHLLASGPLTIHQALVVPLRPGRRHLIPQARWGHVCTDTGPLPWTTTDAHILTSYATLRRTGFTAEELTHPSPSYRGLRHLPRHDQARILTTWQHITPWRCPDSPWLALASRICKEETR